MLSYRCRDLSLLAFAAVMRAPIICKMAEDSSCVPGELGKAEIRIHLKSSGECCACAACLRSWRKMPVMISFETGDPRLAPSCVDPSNPSTSETSVALGFAAFFGGGAGTGSGAGSSTQYLSYTMVSSRAPFDVTQTYHCLVDHIVAPLLPLILLEVATR